MWPTNPLTSRRIRSIVGFTASNSVATIWSWTVRLIFGPVMVAEKPDCPWSFWMDLLIAASEASGIPGPAWMPPWFTVIGGALAGDASLRAIWTLVVSQSVPIARKNTAAAASCLCAARNPTTPEAAMVRLTTGPAGGASRGVDTCHCASDCETRRTSSATA